MYGNKRTFLLILCVTALVCKCYSEIATCNPLACKLSACSDNLDCECLSLASNSTSGICAALVVSCTSLVRCNSDNRTCSIENTICVNNTRCGRPVCYPLALANKQVCPSSFPTTSTYSPITVEPVVTLCPEGHIPLITGNGNDQLDFYLRFPVFPSCVNISINSNAGIYNVCSTGQMNISANGNGNVIMQRSSPCPRFVNISLGGNSNVYNICSSDQLNKTANGNSGVTGRNTSICPRFVNITLGGNAKVYNICVTDQLTIYSTTGNNHVSLNYQQMSSCPKVVNIVNGGGISNFFVCATQAINAKLTSISTVYYKGPLNHTELSGLASIKQWI